MSKSVAARYSTRFSFVRSVFAGLSFLVVVDCSRRGVSLMWLVALFRDNMSCFGYGVDKGLKLLVDFDCSRS